MKLKNTAFVKNVTVNGASTPDWGTDLGQGVKHTFTLEGFPDIVNAMVYFRIFDERNIRVILGKGIRTPKPFSEYRDSQLMLASLFTKVYLNKTRLNDQQFIMFIIRDERILNDKGGKNNHYHRCQLKFSNSILYNDIPVNQNCIDAITAEFGLTDNGSWVIMDMIIENEDELHLYGFPIDESPVEYGSKEERNKDFENRQQMMTMKLLME